ISPSLRYLFSSAHSLAPSLISLFCIIAPLTPTPPLSPYTTLFRSRSRTAQPESGRIPPKRGDPQPCSACQGSPKKRLTHDGPTSSPSPDSTSTGLSALPLAFTPPRFAAICRSKPADSLRRRPARIRLIVTRSYA